MLPCRSPLTTRYTRDGRVAFVRDLQQGYLQRGHDWENHTLDRFLEALAAWMASSDGWYRNFGEELPANGDWTFIARALSAATVYE
ncbi:hypothetical protein SSP35_52_00090 [Streptomyces sp. NBRC 110611]|uniref:DUF7660 family protein n=1 Tax=Streptomyces sp. NBRC 110611 TaxID=1621259 RepID=UPI0008552559|nr:hypothetical protein [Streptomyces sp. NBRC 110611]GAU71586.1 hypothetical protein SSP35_52_00090 [Streptomyces sp. NBRC 110611]